MKKKFPKQMTVSKMTESAKKEKKKIFLKKTTLKYILILVCIYFITIFFFHMSKKTFFPIHHVEIVSQNIDFKNLKKIIQLNLKGGFFSFSREKISAALHQNPLISYIGFKRIWPDRLVIILEEEVPVAQWEKEGLLNENGKLFHLDKKNFNDQFLPILHGADAKKVLKKYQNIQHFFQKGQIQDFFLNAQYGWIAHLRSDCCSFTPQKIPLCKTITLYFGFHHITERLTHWIALNDYLHKNPHSCVVFIDLRYPHGAAVRFDPESKDQNTTMMSPAEQKKF